MGRRSGLLHNVALLRLALVIVLAVSLIPNPVSSYTPREQNTAQTNFRVSGAVILKTGPASRGRVEAYPPGAHQSVASAQIQSNGTYSMTLASGAYDLGVEVESYYPMKESILLTGDYTQNFDLATYDSHAITGTVLGLTAPQLSSLGITVQDGSSFTPGPTGRGKPNDTSGVYALNVPSGTWRVTPGNVTGKVTPAAATVVVSSADVGGQNFNYIDGYTITGTVTLANGPASLGRVDIYLPGGSQPTTNAQIQAGGLYTITLPAGTYQLRTSVNQYFPLVANVTLPAAPSVPVNFNLGTYDTHSISGRLTGLSTQELSNVWINISDATVMGPSSLSAMAQPDALTGNYIAYVPNGTWRLSPGSVPGKTAPQSLSVTILDGNSTGQDFAYATGLTVAGTVALKAGASYRGNVMAYLPGQFQPSAGGSIQPNGSYEITLSPGAYELRTDVGGYFPESQAITVSNSMTVNFDLASTDPYTITGSVSGLASLSDMQWQGLSINVQASNMYGPGPSANVQPVRPSGVFTMYVPTGNWRINPPQLSNYVSPPSQLAQVSQEHPSTSLPAFAFTSGHTISGTVSVDGVPVSAWQGRVDAFDSTANNYASGTPIGSGGSYALTLGNGSYVVRPQVNGYFPSSQSFNNLSADHPNTDFDVAAGNPYTISGTITGVAADRLPQVSLWVQDASQQGPGPSAWISPDPGSGRYSVRVPAGTWRVMANQMAGYGRPNPATVVVSSEIPTATADLAFQSGFSVVGTVYDPSHNPVARTGLHLFNADHSVDQGGGTDDQGRYEFGGLQNGDYTIEVMVPWGVSGLLPPSPPPTVTIAGGSVTRDITFGAATKRIVGTVRKTSPSGPVVQGAEVSAGMERGGGWSNARTDVDGQFSLSVGPGTWRVNVHPSFQGSAPDWTYSGPPSIVTFTDDSSSEQQTVDFVVEVTDATVRGLVLRPDGTQQQGGFVSIDSPQGRGGGPIQPNGTFQVPVKAGTYQVHIFTNDPRVSAPPSLSNAGIAVANGESKDLGTIRLIQKTTTIVGRVTRSDTGGAVAGVRIHANSTNGTEWADATADTDGNYTLWVNAGWWRVGAAPSPDDPYAAAEGMEVRAVDGEATTLNIQLTPADSIIVGRTVLASDPSVAVTNIFGGAFAFNQATNKPASGAPLQGGTFQIRVPAGTWQVGVGMPPGSGYSMSGGPQEVIVASGATATVTVPLVGDDAVLRGTLRLYPAGTPVTGLAVQIFAGNGRGGGSMARYDQSTGQYVLQVSAGTWDRHVELPASSGYALKRGQQMEVTVNTGQTVDADILLVQATRTISGHVSDPSGQPMMGAFIALEDPVRNGKDRFVTGGQTDQNGDYAISVSPGSYQVRANGRFDLGYLAPAPANVDTTDANVGGIDFAFTTSDATLSGQVTLDGGGVRGMVRARGADGSGAMAMTDNSGNYTLNLAAGTWQLEAVSHDSTTFYRSSEISLTVSTGETTLDLAVSAVSDIPPAGSTTFDSSMMQVIRLSDGTELRIPAGALATEGQVTVSASPKAEVPSQGGIRPVSVGYDLRAVDANGQIITNFNQYVTIVLHYTHAQLAGLGITEDDLLASYWDETTSSWRPVSNMSVDRDNDTVSISVDHFTDYALTTAGTTEALMPSRAQIIVVPPSAAPVVGTPITASVAISNVSSLGGFQFTLVYSPSLVSVQAVSLGDFITGSGRTFTETSAVIDNNLGTATFGATSSGSAPAGPSGAGTIANVRLLPLGAGATSPSLASVSASNVTGQTIPLDASDGPLVIGACLGDLDGSGGVDIADVQGVAGRWNTSYGQQVYSTRYDFDSDSDIDISDVQTVAGRWNAACGGN